MKKEWCKSDRRLFLDFPFVGQRRIFSLSQSIGLSGMLCRTSQRIDEMTLLDIKFRLPRSGTGKNCRIWVTCIGVVVNCEKKEAGTRGHPYEVEIFFNRISDKNLSILANYVDGKRSPNS